MSEYTSLATTEAPVEAPASGASSSSGALLAAGVAAATFAVAKSARAAVSPPIKFADLPGTGDNKVLNLPLLLEALETELYFQAVQRLTTGGTGGDRAPAGLQVQGLNVAADSIDVKYLTTFREVEISHRAFLDGQQGAASLLRSGRFQNMRFDFGINGLSRAQVLEVILDAERTGVAAYLGGIKFLSSRGLRQVAASIQGVEARHTTLVYITINRLARAGVEGFTGGRNVFPVMSPVSSPARNDRDTVGREPTSAQDLTGVPLITRGAAGKFVPQPTQPATPDNVLAKVSPFIVLPQG